MLNRRIFLTGTLGAVCATPLLHHPSTAQTNPFKLTPQKSKTSLLEKPDLLTDVWAYNGTVPGPVIRAKKGEEVNVEVVNQLDQPTSVHWHGIRIDNAMDGVSNLTQDPIQPGDSFTYRFIAPDAGTYWYHPHNRTWEQLARGLYGTLIVEGDADASAFDRDYSIVADDWRLQENGSIHEESLGSLRDWVHAGRLGNILTLNGKDIENQEVMAGERIRLRFVNSATARIMRFALEGLKPWLVALDGQPIKPTQLPARGITIAPSQRADIVVDIKGKPGDRIAINETTASEPLTAGYLTLVEGEKPTRDNKPPTLVSNAIPKPDLAKAKKMDLLMTGGAMRFLTEATYKGEKLNGRTLAQTHKQAWAFNGQAGMSDTPFFSLRRGETIVLKIINETAWPHAIHVHGHHFLVRAKGPRSTRQLNPITDEEENAYRDTVLVERDEIVEIAFVADNPGKWMLHCHMLEHQAAGMGTWFEVI